MIEHDPSIVCLLFHNDLSQEVHVSVPRIVEKLNPEKSSAIRQKRESERAGRSGKSVAITELTFQDVKNDAITLGLATDVLSQISAGKEASIYLALWKNHPIILKAYRFWHSSHARKKRGFFAPGQMEVLAAKEYDLLTACFNAGMRVPTPISRVGNYLTMRFIGDGHTPAPQLKDVVLDNPEAVLDDILDMYFIMYSRVHHVHGDLSAFNLLWWHNAVWMIDLPQAYEVGPWSNMKKVVAILRADIHNLLQYFQRYGVSRDPNRIVRIFLDEYIPRNMRYFDEDLSQSGASIGFT